MIRRAVLRSPFARWGLVAVLQLCLIALPLADRLDVQLNGQEVTLATRPVDPRDLLRGDYVVINLAIRQIPQEIAATLPKPRNGETVYVGLQADADGVFHVDNISRTRAEAGSIALEGVIRTSGAASFTVNYGIDTFYVAEGTGRQIERLDAKRVHLVVAVSADGRALPIRLLVDGKPFKSDAAF